LNEKDEELLLYKFNDTKRAFPKDKLLQELFEERAEKSSSSDAIIFKNKIIKYKELNESSNQLARKLRERGVKSDQIVGLMVEDISIEIIIGIIGIIKAGGAFLPIDPDLPDDRIEYMIKDSNVTILLTQGRYNDKIKFGGSFINLEDRTLYTGERSNLARVNRSSDLVYVFYTSGSTGKPKGVQIEHTGIVNQIYGLNDRYKFDSSFHHILLASITFDPSVQQIFMPLTSGGKLFLVSKSTKQSVKELWEFIVSNQIDIVNTVPSLMNILLDHADSHKNLHFKYIILAGEVFSKNLYLRLRESISADRIINIYGPTEATINTTLYECKHEEIKATISIGKPLMNYSVMILDENLNLLPIDVPGEICISGVGLARGYLNNPKMTAEKFVANPFAPGERMYKTGDLGRWTPEGNIEFIGRIDHQVKIHGIRIELGEIEAAIGQHPAVRETVVIDREDHLGNLRLVAYIVPSQEQKLTIDELRRFLRDKLPEYMIPSAFVIKDAFSLTPHGKVDRRALLESEPIKQEPEDTFAPPRNELESQLTIVWEKVLGSNPIGVKDNFFKLGGTSLLAMVLFAEIEKIFGKQLPLAAIFDSPTIEDLARMLTKEDWSTHWSPLVAIQPEGSNLPFFCVHGHRGNVIGFQDLAADLGMEQPFYGIQARGLDGTPVGERHIEDMAADYVNEIRTIQPRGPYFLGGWCMGAVLAFEMAHQLQETGEKVAMLAMIEPPHAGNYASSRASLILRPVYRIIERIDYEFNTLRRIGTRDKLSHLSRKFKTAITRTQVNIEKMIESLLAKLHLHVPHSRTYMLNALHEAHEKALLSYNPRPYKGRVAIFRASKQPLGIYHDPSLGWSTLIKDEVELHEIPGHYLNAFIEPSVHILGAKIKICLDEAKQNI
jgi:amino acid adenylation domain-containing protein